MFLHSPRRIIISRLLVCSPFRPSFAVSRLGMGGDVWMRCLGPVAPEGADWMHFNNASAKEEERTARRKLVEARAQLCIATEARQQAKDDTDALKCERDAVKDEIARHQRERDPAQAQCVQAQARRDQAQAQRDQAQAQRDRAVRGTRKMGTSLKQVEQTRGESSSD